MMVPSTLYPQQMYEQMFRLGIKSGRNGVFYEQEYNSMNFNQTSENRLLGFVDDIENY